MTTIEIIENFMKGNCKVSISEKQKNWLLRTAKTEGFAVSFDGWSDAIYLTDCYYKISQCKRLSSGGSYVGSKSIQGRYNIEKMYTIRFTENQKHTAVCGQTDIDYFKRENIGFEIIQPYINTSTR